MDPAMFVIIPGPDTALRPGYQVKLHRFDNAAWEVQYGWYAWANNTETLGWYLTQVGCPKVLKPLKRTDLDDIYLIKA